MEGGRGSGATKGGGRTKGIGEGAKAEGVQEGKDKMNKNAPCAASLSITCPSGVISSLVIIPREPNLRTR
jgi:hypothetical protein